MELSSLERFNSTHQAFLDQLTESIGIVYIQLKQTRGPKTSSNNRNYSRQSFRIARKSCKKPTLIGRKSALQSGEGSICEARG